jgi:alpha-tubulin suppressor-like RCC1 family protein
MTDIDCCTPSLPAPPPPRGGRVRQLTRRLAPVLAPALIAAALGCREDAQSPTGPEPEPALDITPAQALSFRQVSAGFTHTCAVTTSDVAYCWGDNDIGQLGAGTPIGRRLTPVAVAGGLRFRQVSAGSNHTCGVTTDNRAFCWGDNHSGQLGNGSTGDHSIAPVAVLGGRRFRQVSAGAEHSCAVTPLDVAFCWGSNFSGQLGDGVTEFQSSTPVRVAGGLRFRQVSAGGQHTCGVTTSDRAFCWGRNLEAQLGDGTTSNSLTPVAAASGRRFRQVNAGGQHTCGVTPHDAGFCWGLNDAGQLGDGTTTTRPTPVRVHGGFSFLHLEAGFVHTCGVTTDNRAFCWGRGGLVGDGTFTGRLKPVAVASERRFRQVSAGGRHACGVTPTDRAFCWGSNDDGQLGDGTTTQRLTPVRVVGPT